jgi:hypothetical protein
VAFFFCRKTIILGTQLYFLGTIVETMVLNGSYIPSGYLT